MSVPGDRDRPRHPLDLPPLVLGGGDPRLAQVAAAWVYGQASENTRRAYWADLGAFAAFCAERGADILAAERDDVEGFRAAAEEAGASPATVARRLAALASFYRYAGGEAPTAVNPMAAVDRPVVPSTSVTDVLVAAEAAALVTAARAQGPKAASLVYLLLLDGLKLGEAVAADAGDVGLDDRPATLRLRRAEHEVIDLDRRTARALADYLAGRHAGPLLLAHLTDGAEPRRLTRFGANYLLKRAVEAAGLAPSVSANTLRRTYAAAALGSGSQLRTVQRHLGHADSRTTRRLGHPD